MPDYDTEKDHDLIRHYAPQDAFVIPRQIHIPTFTMRKRSSTDTRFRRRDR